MIPSRLVESIVMNEDIPYHEELINDRRWKEGIDHDELPPIEIT
jgi:hypothetical protein